ncbi:hypothetical protein [Methylobacterium sp. sgz302541]|uniref:hypothetical protein n=1 Tax=unclassified Methylobacterium TaxID=2615210 RepID=UPI003D33E047
MPRAFATSSRPPASGGSRIVPMLSGAAFLAGIVLVPGVGSAEGGYARSVPSAHRCAAPRPGCHARGPSMPPAVVRAYLPRNDAVPMYNEPPPRFPER